MMIENTITARPIVDGENTLSAVQRFEPFMQRLRQGDCNAVLEADAIELLADIRKASQAEYARVKALLKQANRRLALGPLDAAVKAVSSSRAVPETHHGYASDTLRWLTVGEWSPVTYDGTFYVLDPLTSLWTSYGGSELTRLVAETYDAHGNCKRRSDYDGIARHAVDLAEQPRFFSEAATGIACPAGFYHVAGDQIGIEPLQPKHRQRVQLPFVPKEEDTPLFDKFLTETFQSEVAGEEEAQRLLVQEIAGAILLNLMPKYHKAVLFYDPIGRAGKGTLERILRQLVPEGYATSISPFKWHEPHSLAKLAGRRLNVVGELPDNQAIPASEFKTVIGGDLLTGRLLYQNAFEFTNEAAHVFMSNHLIPTREHTDAFFSRWLIVEFPNSLQLTGKMQDATLPERIIMSEMPGIAWWALQGAARLLRNQRFTNTPTHNRLMEKWRCGASSLDEFIHELCELDGSYTVRRSEFYKSYVLWCVTAERTPFGKSKVLELLRSSARHGIRLVKPNNTEVFRGVRIKAESFTSDNDDDF